MNHVQNKFALLGLLLLASCGPLVKIGDTGPAPQRFTLHATPTDGTAIALPVLRVEALDTSADLSTARIAVRIGTQEVRYISGGIWTDKPAQLLRNLLADHVRARSTAVVLAANQQDVATPFRVAGRLIAFQAEGDGTVATHAAVSAELFILQGAKIIASRNFSRRRTLASDSASDVTASVNTATNELAIDAANWIAETLAQTK